MGPRKTLKFWRADAWRTWSEDRRRWKAHKKQAPTSTPPPPRPVSPVWSLAGAFVLLMALASVGGEDAAASPGVKAVSTTTSSVLAGDTPPRAAAGTTTTTAPTTTTTHSATPAPDPEATIPAPATSTALRPAPGSGARSESSSSSTSTNGTLTVHFIDVGQGDATLIQGPDFTMLIDTGRHDRSDVVPYLRAVGVTEIDLLIGTHPHADHIGQFPQVLETFPVGEVWMSGASHTTQSFERTLDAILDSNAGYHEPRAGESYTLGALRVEVVHPASSGSDLNDGSVSIRLVYGTTSFLFTGDAYQSAEAAMIARGHNLSADVLQMGHHGSNTSTGSQFLQAVQPEIAIYSASAGNQYGHPHSEVISRLNSAGTTIYGTAAYGTVRVVTDGSGYTVETERDAQAAASANTAQDTPTAAPAPQATSLGCAAGQTNINTATHSQLQNIWQIGPARATEMIELRPFTSVDDMVRIIGISPNRVAEIKEQGVACVP